MKLSIFSYVFFFFLKWPAVRTGVLGSLQVEIEEKGFAFFKIIYLFTSGCVGSSFLCEGFL